MSPSERAAVDQAHRQFGEPTATPKPRAGEHTPGPWSLAAHPDEKGIGLYSYAWGFLGFLNSGAPDKANARRIVACVNACEGITIEELESGTVQRWYGAERDLLRERERELVELLKAVEFITVVSNKCPVCLGWDSKWGEQARKHTKNCKLAAALAKHGR